jgi:hypothetical protein
MGLNANGLDGDRRVLPYLFEEVIGFELTNNFRFGALLGLDVVGQCDLSLWRSGKYRLSLG